MKILVTGANGFVGEALIPKLLDEGHEVFALVRSLDKGKSKAKKKNTPINWIEGDLLRPESLSPLPEIDRAYYLVHSLKDEGAFFEHQEAMSAVNFLNWIRPTGAGIIYLGGIIPEAKHLSPHLRSRMLTGAILRASGLKTIEFRASIILGEGSLSFEMIKALSERFPVRPEVSLLNKPCQPLALGDLLNYLVQGLSLEVSGSEIIEIGGPEVSSYGELLDLYSELAGLKRMKVKLPAVEVRVLMRALDYALPEYADVGKKLAESLEHATVVQDHRAKKLFPKIEPLDLRVAMDLARSQSKSTYPPVWDKEFFKSLLSDKILTQSGLLSPEVLKNLERMAKIRDIISRR